MCEWNVLLSLVHICSLKYNWNIASGNRWCHNLSSVFICSIFSNISGKIVYYKLDIVIFHTNTNAAQRKHTIDKNKCSYHTIVRKKNCEWICFCFKKEKEATTRLSIKTQTLKTSVFNSFTFSRLNFHELMMNNTFKCC